MKKSTVMIALVVLLAGGTGTIFFMNQKSDSPKAATGNHEAAEATDLGELVDLTSQTTVSMDIKDFVYSRPNIKIKKGTKVTWTNRDGDEHNAMREHSGSDIEHEAPALSEVKPDVFAGPLLATGESYSFTFNETGVLSYHCAPHPYMKGSVTVID